MGNLKARHHDLDHDYLIEIRLVFNDPVTIYKTLILHGAFKCSQKSALKCTQMLFKTEKDSIFVD